MRTVLIIFITDYVISYRYGNMAKDKRKCQNRAGRDFKADCVSVFSQIITLYITPVFYVYMEKFQEKIGNWRSRKKRSKDEMLYAEK